MSMTCPQLPSSDAYEELARYLLEPCLRDDADQATAIRKQLKVALGKWQAEAVLGCYKEACLRHKGICKRYFVDAAGATQRLRRPVGTPAAA